MRALLGFLLLSTSLIAHAAPQLIDMVVGGTLESPTLTPLQLEFAVGQEYLLVLVNDKPYSVTFHYDKFGQTIFTQFLQGTPSVTQESFDLLAQSKITWHFTPQEAGEFVFYAGQTGLNTKGEPGKIVVKKPAEPSKENSEAQEEVTEEIAASKQQKVPRVFSGGRPD